MRQFTFSLDTKSVRPMIQFNGIVALLDTGAELPVWTADFNTFKWVFPNSTLIQSNIPLSGIGGIVLCPAYKCTLSLGEIVYQNIPILFHEMPNTSFHLIISAAMFKGLLYEIDTVNNKLNITIPHECDMVRNLQLIDSNGNMHILLNENVDNTWSKYCEKFYIKNEESEILRLQKLYNTTDRSELLRKIEHDFLT